MVQARFFLCARTRGQALHAQARQQGQRRRTEGQVMLRIPAQLCGPGCRIDIFADAVKTQR